MNNALKEFVCHSHLDMQRGPQRTSSRYKASTRQALQGDATNSQDCVRSSAKSAKG